MAIRATLCRLCPAKQFLNTVIDSRIKKNQIVNTSFEQAIHIENLDQRERNQVSVHDQFTEHGLSEEVIAKMRAQLAAIDDLKEALSSSETH